MVSDSEWMSLQTVLSEYRDGDENGWDAEFDYLWEREEPYLDRLSTSIQETGMQEPILLGNDGRVWNGHHRLCVAWSLGMPMVPVRRAPIRESVDTTEDE